MQFSLARWWKQISICLVIAGHDPPLDITVLMDISRNPGPTNDLFDICSGGQNLVHGGNLHISSSTQTISPSNNGLGARFGIPSLITMRPTVTSGYNRPVFCTFTDVPIDISQCSSLRTNLMKLCNLNARSIKSKSADFLCYAKSCAADIFAITETWLVVHLLRTKLLLPISLVNFSPRRLSPFRVSLMKCQLTCHLVILTHSLKYLRLSQ